MMPVTAMNRKAVAITIATTKTRAASDPRMKSVDGPTLREGRVVPSLTWAISGWMAWSTRHATTVNGLNHRAKLMNAVQNGD
jgi:hypothetical protein